MSLNAPCMKLEYIEVGVEGRWFLFFANRLIPNLGQVIGSGSNAHCSGEKEGRDRGRESHAHNPSPGLLT